MEHIPHRGHSGPPLFVVSLDVELNWGLLDARPKGRYDAHIRGERAATRRILETFKEFDIHATWAIVGFLFAETRCQLQASLPKVLPKYKKEELCPYRAIPALGESEHDDPFHYGTSLVRMIRAQPHQEIATHSFSHYYCLEDGQDVTTFAADLQAALDISDQNGLEVSSIVFPRNQINPNYLETCGKMGLRAYRGCEGHWIYSPKTRGAETLVRRGLRLADAYINISGHHSTVPKPASECRPVDIAQSRFLRPYSPHLARLELLRFRRIRGGLDRAAQRCEMFHLWWHPHNFGVHLEQNISFLRRILEHVCVLRERDGMVSLNMREVAERVSSHAPDGVADLERRHGLVNGNGDR